jgi:predicted PhzF superfamily epimerase YddE/YHI9
VDDATMQALARQFNLSETPSSCPRPKATARVRIFTPSYEMPFAATRRSAPRTWCARCKGGGDSVALEMKAGVIPVNAQGDRWTLQANAPEGRAFEMTRGELEEILGLAPATSAEWPLWVSTGRSSSSCRSRARRRCAARAPRRRLQRAEERGWQQHGLRLPRRAAMPRARSSAASSSPAARRSSRIPPPARRAPTWAAGSPCAPADDVTRVVSQGEAVARPSTLYLDVTHGAIHVGGDVIELGRDAAL